MLKLWMLNQGNIMHENHEIEQKLRLEAEKISKDLGQLPESSTNGTASLRNHFILIHIFLPRLLKYGIL